MFWLHMCTVRRGSLNYAQIQIPNPPLVDYVRPVVSQLAVQIDWEYWWRDLSVFSQYVRYYMQD